MHSFSVSKKPIVLTNKSSGLIIYKRGCNRIKSKKSCHCYIGKVEVAGGKIKAPLNVQAEGGDYKSFIAMGKKSDPEFLVVQGDAFWQITNGMSVLFQTVDREYCRIFFYKTLNKNKQANKEAPPPSDFLK